MNRRINQNENLGFAAWARRAVTVAAVLAGGLGVALGVFAAPLPASPITATPYSWPTFHAGGTSDPASLVGTPPLVPYNQLQGTPSGLVGSVATQIPSFLLGNTGAGTVSTPPGSGGTNGFNGTAPNFTVPYFPNHFADGPLFQNHFYQITGPLSFLQPPAGQAAPPADVQCSPVAVNSAEYQEIAYMYYDGVAVNAQATVGGNQTVGNGTSEGAPSLSPYGTGPGQPLVTSGPNAIRQVVYFGRTETLPVILNGAGVRTVGGVPAPAGLALGTYIHVGAIYAMDGFTGGVIWRYQTPAFFPSSQASNNSFAAHITGTAHSQTATGPQPFQVGPDGHDSKGVITDTASTPLSGQNFAPGTFDTYVHAGTLPSPPTNGFQFSLYAKTGVAGPNSGTNPTALYTGTFRIFPSGSNADDTNIVGHGTFTAKATFDLATDPQGRFATVTGTFSPDTSTQYPFNGGLPARFTGTFDARSGQQIISGNLQTIPGSGGTIRDGAVLSSIAVARVNVNVPAGYPGQSAGSTTATKLVVVAADNNGYVYCLDALGNGYRDNLAESNNNVLYQNTTNASPNFNNDPNSVGQVNYDYQPTFGGYTASTQPHVGTTFPYWIYRPDPGAPHNADGTVDTAPGADHNLPVPSAFRLASPTVYVNSTKTVGYQPATGTTPIQFGTLAPGAGPSAAVTGTGLTTGGALSANATVYVGNSNGVLYALDATGGVDPAAAAFNAALTNVPGIADATATCNPLWWFAASGGNAAHASNFISIESAPAVFDDGSGDPQVYVGTTLDTIKDPTGSAGILYQLDGVVGPGGPAGAKNYNVNPKPTHKFPANGTELGNISGSPVVFANPSNPGKQLIYFAADTGPETVIQDTGTQDFPASTATGRIWCVDPNLAYQFAYPSADNPDAKTPAAFSAPLNGGFLHATPAIGVVQYPQTIRFLNAGAPTDWDHADGVRTTLRGNSVPMLYVGTTGNSAALYYLDLDGTNNTQREVFAVPDQSGVGFQSSPVLVTNSAGAAGGGNGGAIFVTAGPNLYQFQATPTTSASQDLPEPQVRLDYGGLNSSFVGGPISAPAVAAATVSDISTVTINGTQTSQTITDWVYVGNTTDGLCYGYTPRGFGKDTTNGYLPPLLPPQPPATVHAPGVNQFPLRAFVFDNSPAHPASSTDLNSANAVDGNLPVFEWGQTIFFRIANVVPPDGSHVLDPTDPTGHHYFVYNGTAAGAASGINIVTEAETRGGALLDNTRTTLNIPPVVISTPSTAAPDPSQQNGFYQRTDAGTTAAKFGNTSELDSTGVLRAPETVLLDQTTGKGWVAAGAYNIGFSNALDPSGADPNRHNTPGYRRKIISATESVTRFDDSATNPDPPTTVVLTLGGPNASFSYKIINSANTGNYDPATGNGDSGNIFIDQPTYGILNPLAVRGAGVTLNGQGTHAPWVDSQGHEGIGPFMGVDPATFGTGPTALVDLEALSNGNSVLSAVPPSGQLSLDPAATGPSDPTRVSANLQRFRTLYKPYQRYVIVTTTGDVAHGTNGDNTDTSGSNLPATFSRTTPVVDDTRFGPYTLDVADRSSLNVAPTGNAAKPILSIRISRADLNWNDNSPIPVNGQFSRINPLVWEGSPTTIHRDPPGATVHTPEVRQGVNTTDPNFDYPNIPGRNVTHTLVTGGGSFAVTDPSSANLPPVIGTGAQSPDAGRQVQPNPVQMTVSVPKYQPANLQLYTIPSTGNPRVGVPITPSQLSGNPYLFPMGYITRERIYASINGQFDDNSPYRDVDVYTGVPVDLSTSISNQVTDVGIVPHGFGIQMDAYAPGGTAIGPFMPLNTYLGYQGHFVPLTIYNHGNTNLIDPHLDQKVQYGTGTPGSLPLLSDALDTSLFDPLSFIPAYDLNGARTGPRTGLGGTEKPYLLRSSLDTDLATAFGVNPGLALSPDKTLFPVPTFHKARVIDGQNLDFPGTVMTVPDVPHDNVAGSPFYLPVSDVPLVNAASQPIVASKPLVSVAVPIGTPVGTYSQTLRMFEGFDATQANPYNPLIGPTYNGLSVGQLVGQSSGSTFDPYTLDTYRLAQRFDASGNPLGPPQPLVPVSDPGTTIKVTVQEARLTDAFTPGDLPMIDLAPVNGRGAADFQPAAFRDPVTGSLSLYWTTSRDYAPGNGKAPYRIAGANLGFNNQSGNSYFTPDPGGSGQRWWVPLSLRFPANPPGAGTPIGSDTGFNAVIDQPYYFNGAINTSDKTAYGFDINVTGSGRQNFGQSSGTSSQTSIYCYPLDPATGAVKASAGGGNPVPVPVVNSPLPKSGVHGLKFTGVSFPDPNKGTAITSDLWAFWAGGVTGRTALYYSSAPSSGVTAYSSPTQASPFAGAAVLPVPASLVSVSNPSAVLTYAPDPTLGAAGTATPVLEVTYDGTTPGGSANVYVSRYRPYHPQAPNGQVNSGVTLLTLMPFRQLTEQLQLRPTSPWWQARDVGWLRNGALDVYTTVYVNGAAQTPQPQSLLLDTTKTNPDGTHPLLPGVRLTYDRTSGLLVYTGVSLPKVSGVNAGQTVYVDVNGGRVRFSLPLPANDGKNGQPVITTSVVATFNPTARRITTDPVADAAPVAFLDETYLPPASGVGPNVQADRNWYFWHKPTAVGKSSIYPSLWYKTQRLTVALTDSNGLPLPIQVTNSKPQVTVTFSGGTLYDPANGGVADVDATRGRIYFPVTDAGLALEGQTVTINGTDANGKALPTTGVVHWLDEPRYNDSANQIAADNTSPGAQEATVSDGYQVQINTIKNETGVTAFLDPTAYQNTSSAIAAPHDIWLFWTSTRNGTSDIFYETVNPRFTPVIPSSGAP